MTGRARERREHYDFIFRTGADKRSQLLQHVIRMVFADVAADVAKDIVKKDDDKGRCG